MKYIEWSDILVVLLSIAGGICAVWLGVDKGIDESKPRDLKLEKRWRAKRIFCVTCVIIGLLVGSLDGLFSSYKQSVAMLNMQSTANAIQVELGAANSLIKNQRDSISRLRENIAFEHAVYDRLNQQYIVDARTILQKNLSESEDRLKGKIEETKKEVVQTGIAYTKKGWLIHIGNDGMIPVKLINGSLQVFGVAPKDSNIFTTQDQQRLGLRLIRPNGGASYYFSGDTTNHHLTVQITFNTEKSEYVKFYTLIKSRPGVWRVRAFGHNTVPGDKMSPGYVEGPFYLKTNLK